MTSEDHGNGNFLKPTLSSTEDLSEYTDADESMSAPTEFLAEFLSAIMLKDYRTALKYCKLILHYEPHNARAKEFYPLIVEKLQCPKNKSSESDNDDDSSETSSESETSSSDDSSEAQEEEEEDSDVELDNIKETKNKKKGSKESSNGENTTGSYSSLEDDEVVIDQLAALTAKYNVDNVDFGNGNKIYQHANILPTTSTIATPTDNQNSFQTIENKFAYGISSDSESPTEPVTQEMIAMLRARVTSN